MDAFQELIIQLFLETHCANYTQAPQITFACMDIQLYNETFYSSLKLEVPYIIYAVTIAMAKEFFIALVNIIL